MSVEHFLSKEASRVKQSAYELAQEIVAKAYEDREANLVKLAELEGQVFVHAVASTLGHYKASLNRGLCWECGERKPSTKSAYLRCDTCEAADE